jgi:ADP-ribose pyrophosphatase YjhB (NUDIX family)
MHCYRHQFSRSLWQVPAGFMQPGEMESECGVIKLHEETGLSCRPSSLASLGATVDTGRIKGLVELFVASCSCKIDPLVIGEEFGTDLL